MYFNFGKVFVSDVFSREPLFLAAGLFILYLLLSVKMFNSPLSRLWEDVCGPETELEFLIRVFLICAVCRITLKLFFC